MKSGVIFIFLAATAIAQPEGDKFQKSETVKNFVFVWLSLNSITLGVCYSFVSLPNLSWHSKIVFAWASGMAAFTTFSISTMILLTFVSLNEYAPFTIMAISAGGFLLWAYVFSPLYYAITQNSDRFEPLIERYTRALLPFRHETSARPVAFSLPDHKGDRTCVMCLDCEAAPVSIFQCGHDFACRGCFTGFMAHGHAKCPRCNAGRAY